MNSKSRILASTLVLFFIIGATLIPFIALAQVTGYYSNNAEINPVAFTLTVTNPQNQTTYSKTMPLQIDLIWNISLESLLDTHMPVKGYAYTIDNKPFVNIEPNGSLAVLRKESYYFNYLVDISGLSQGNHELSVIIWQYYNNSNYQGLFNQSSTPITFNVDNTLPATPSPTPVPEFSWLIIVPLLFASFTIAIATTKIRKRANVQCHKHISKQAS
jgi:hypothetical protein